MFPYRWSSRDPTDEREAGHHQIVLPRTGCWTKLVGKHRFVADRTTAVFYNQGELYRYLHHVPDGACTYLILMPNLVQEATGGAFPATHAPIDPSSDWFHAALLNKLQHDPVPDDLEIEELCLELSHRLIVRSARDGWVSPDAALSVPRKELAEEALRLLERHFRERLTLSDISSALDASPFHLCRVFKAYTGTTIHRKLTQLRIRATAQRLAAGMEPDTTDLALEFGFSSRSHFSDAFRREFGCGPSVFRKQVLRGNGPMPG